MSVTSGCGAIEGVTCSSGFATLRVHLDKSSAGRQWVHRSCESPQRAAVDVELHQFDRAVSGELTEHRKSCDDDTRADDDAVVGATRDELRKDVQFGSEGLDDAKQVEDPGSRSSMVASGPRSAPSWRSMSSKNPCGSSNTPPLGRQ